MNAVREWMDSVAGPGWSWYVKYLSGNDTLLNKAHQAGPYVPNRLIHELFPSLRQSHDPNPRARFSVSIDSAGLQLDPTVIWYNNRLRGGSRNECRITNWGGRGSPLLDPESTGSLCVFAFRQEDPGQNVQVCRIWLCRTVEEEDAVIERIGPVEPGAGTLYLPGGTGLVAPQSMVDGSCHLQPEQLPTGWRDAFPDAQSIVDFVVARLPLSARQPPDKRLLARRDCEFEVFRSVEEAVVLPRILEGFASVDAFVEFANSVTNRRKSRSGASLELQSRRIFDEEALAYSHDEVSEAGKRPDFVFPGIVAYRDARFPASKLRMLGVKTTCKDRWRQILNEADRIPSKHLLTLQQGVSPSQWSEMTQAGITLVVPSGLHTYYHESVRAHLLSFEAFIGETRSICG